MQEIIVYTDGSTSPNPGRGGLGVVILSKGYRTEIGGGYELTTNNRMELLAVIVALESLKHPAKVTVYSDANYIVDSISKGYIHRWKARNWFLKGHCKVKNRDLWERYLAAARDHVVTLKLVKGHSGVPENERCDLLASRARHYPHALEDIGFIEERAAYRSMEEFLDLAPITPPVPVVMSPIRTPSPSFKSKLPLPSPNYPLMAKNSIEKDGLKGSVKQIEWAINLRRGACKTYCDKAGTTQGNAAACIYALEKSAAWWIDKRTDSATNLLAIIASKYPQEARIIMLENNLKQLGPYSIS